MRRPIFEILGQKKHFSRQITIIVGLASFGTNLLLVIVSDNFPERWHKSDKSTFYLITQHMFLRELYDATASDSSAMMPRLSSTYIPMHHGHRHRRIQYTTDPRGRPGSDIVHRYL